MDVARLSQARGRRTSPMNYPSHPPAGAAGRESWLARGRAGVRPAGRGSLFYFAFGALIALYTPFLSYYYARLGLRGWEIGVLAALGPLLLLLGAPWITALADR